MSQRAIPCVLMRGGTSRGPFFLAHDLPSDSEVRDRVLLRAMGSPDVRQIDGLGGATSVTSKVAIVGPSARSGVDVDYLFAQVDVGRALVDTKPTCGNMLAGVGPFAIEEGLVPATEPTTSVTIRNVNTDSIIEATIQTPGGSVAYEGDYSIAGVPGTAAPIELCFQNIVGSKTGAMFPTGQRHDVLSGTTVTCIDVAMPMVVVDASSLRKTGQERPEELDADIDFMAHAERLRCEAGRLMGLGDVADSVIPKLALVAPSKTGAHLASRYLTPWQCHPSYAVSGSIGVATAAAVEGTVVHPIVAIDERFPSTTVVEHPSGTIEVALDIVCSGATIDVRSAGTRRTARKLMSGEVFVPTRAWPEGS